MRRAPTKELIEEHPPGNEEGLGGWLVMFLVAQGVFFIWLFLGTGVYVFFKDPGTLGDSFGAVNALFSGLAFAGVIVAIMLQRQELALQRQELRQTREEFERQTEALDEQRETMDLQRFENTFFNMLRFHREIVDSLEVSETVGRDYSNPNQPLKVKHHGKAYFVYHVTEITSGLIEAAKRPPTPDVPSFDAQAWVCQFFDRFDHSIGDYFRSLETIGSLLDRATIVSKDDYADIVCSQVSNAEGAFIYFYCWTPSAAALKGIVEKFGLLRNTDLRVIESNDFPLKHVDHLAFERGGVAEWERRYARRS
jgi:hypothetical protein